MTRSRVALFVSVLVVALGVIAGLGALWLDSARAAVGPLPGEGLVLPADTQFVMGVDVKRLVASPAWERYASRPSMRPEGLRKLEAWTGLSIDFYEFDRVELAVIPLVVVLASLVGLLPAIAAYRTDVAKALSGGR